jgi:hypothetical protein
MNPRHPRDYQLKGNLTVDADLALRELSQFVNDYVLQRADELAKYGEILREHIVQAVNEEKASGRLKR